MDHNFSVAIDGLIATAIGKFSRSFFSRVMYEGRRSESKKPWPVSFGVYGFLLFLGEGQIASTVKLSALLRSKRPVNFKGRVRHT